MQQETELWKRFRDNVSQSNRLFQRVVLTLLITFLSQNLQAVSQSSARQYLIVGAHQGEGSTFFKSYVEAAGGVVVHDLEHIGVVVARSVDPGFLSKIRLAPSVESMSGDIKVQWIPETPLLVDGRTFLPMQSELYSEPGADLQWNLLQIGADITARLGEHGAGTSVAVLDTGINTRHEDLIANIDFRRSISLVDEEPFIEDLNGHGSHVAGIIAGSINGVGIQGVAPRSKIIAVKVMDGEGQGFFGNLIAGIYYAAQLGVDVINVSGRITLDWPEPVLEPLLAASRRAVAHATASGSLSVFAAGDDGANLESWFGSVQSSRNRGVTVAATGPIELWSFDRLASYSNHGQAIIDVAGPGGDRTRFPRDTWFLDMVLSCWRFAGDDANQYVFASGTSQAAAHVTGVAALIVGKYGKMSPELLKVRMLSTSEDILTPGRDAKSGHGRISAVRATQ